MSPQPTWAVKQLLRGQSAFVTHWTQKFVWESHVGAPEAEVQSEEARQVAHVPTLEFHVLAHPAPPQAVASPTAQKGVQRPPLWQLNPAAQPDSAVQLAPIVPVPAATQTNAAELEG